MASNDKRPAKCCRNCGRTCGGEKKCPALFVTCHNCGKTGHFRRVCRSQTREAPPGGTRSTSGGVTVGGSGGLSASLRVGVSCSDSPGALEVLAVADTGAQVCVAECHLTDALGLSPKTLQRPTANISRLAGARINVLGSKTCGFTLGHVSAKAVLHFADGVCKDLSLVPPNFPIMLPTVGGVTEEDTPEPPARPTVSPYHLTEENVHRLEKWFLGHFGRTAFAVDCSPLPEMSGPPHHIHLRSDAQPYAVHAPATIPHHFYDEVRRQLDEDVRRGIIEPVPEECDLRGLSTGLRGLSAESGPPLQHHGIPDAGFVGIWNVRRVTPSPTSDPGSAW
ncbi:hypothetical protein GWK47_038944 [Chionoecetes opilio]|uniref:CCHC-type domain-containing protein n=1 Tax=Chionoecetes opilio TaxID=41210 RepID=A0A8J5CLV6_CHIOP|nr:hypothetical protein GWK47_038944 [Chionoecetes opilio]